MKKEATEPHSGVVEKRANPRFLVSLSIEYWQIDKSKSRPGQTIDISEGGLLHTHAPLLISEWDIVFFGLTLFKPPPVRLDELQTIGNQLE